MNHVRQETWRRPGGRDAGLAARATGLRDLSLVQELRPAPVVATYAPAPVVAAYAPAPVMAAYAPACPTVVNYVPQTAYRTVYYSTPVTAFSPVAACGPCGQTTVMRPVTTYVTQARLVPYMTYRPVVAAMPVAACPTGCPTAAPVATAAYYAPAAPACCGAAPAAATVGYAPAAATVNYAPAPAAVNYAPAPAAVNYAPAPARLPPPTRSRPRRPPRRLPEPGPAAKHVSVAAEPDVRQLEPRTGPATAAATTATARAAIADRVAAALGTSNTSVPRALDPEDALDKSTALPSRQSMAMRPVSTVAPKAAVKLDDGGWRSARN